MFRSMRVLLALGLAGSLATDSYALGGANIGNEVPSARAAGQGYTAVAGQNDDPTAVFSNPGAITKLKGTQATFGFHWENLHGMYESNSGSKAKMRSQDAIVPNFSVTQSFMDGRLGAGFTMQSPFGLETHWGNGPLRYVATNSRLNATMLSPVVAYKVHDTVSIGAGPDFVNIFNAQLDRNVNVDAVNLSLFTNASLGSITSGSADAVSSLRGQGTAWGYHAGILYQPVEAHALGLTYHSKKTVRINGNVKLSNMSGTMATVFGGSDYETSAYTDITFPTNIQMGYAYKPTEKWLVETDIAWYHWSQEKDLNVRFAETNTLRRSLLNQGNPATFNLKDRWSFAAGSNYKMTDRLQVRGGLWYEPWAMPEQNFNPAFLDLTRIGLSSGLGYGLTENLTLDFAYTAMFTKKRSINNNVGNSTSGIPTTGVPSVGIPSAEIDGSYTNFTNLVALGLSYKFGLSD